MSEHPANVHVTCTIQAAGPPEAAADLARGVGEVLRVLANFLPGMRVVVSAELTPAAPVPELKS